MAPSANCATGTCLSSLLPRSRDKRRISDIFPAGTRTRARLYCDPSTHVDRWTDRRIGLRIEAPSLSSLVLRLANPYGDDRHGSPDRARSQWGSARLSAHPVNRRDPSVQRPTTRRRRRRRSTCPGIVMGFASLNTSERCSKTRLYARRRVRTRMPPATRPTSGPATTTGVR